MPDCDVGASTYPLFGGIALRNVRLQTLAPLFLRTKCVGHFVNHYHLCRDVRWTLVIVAYDMAIRRTPLRQLRLNYAMQHPFPNGTALITSVGLGGADAAQRPFLGRAADIFGGGEGQEPEPSRRGSRPQPNDGGARNQAPAGRDRRATRHVHQDGRRPYAPRREIGLGVAEGRSRDFCADGRLTRREQLDGGGGAGELSPTLSELCSSSRN